MRCVLFTYVGPGHLKSPHKVQRFGDGYRIRCGTCGFGPFSIAYVSLCTMIFVVRATEAASLDSRALHDLELLLNRLQRHQVCTMRQMATYCLTIIHQKRCHTEVRATPHVLFLMATKWLRVVLSGLQSSPWRC